MTSVGMEVPMSNLEAALPLFTGQVNSDDYRVFVIFRFHSNWLQIINFQNVA